jgi:NAD(P)-dependent dehydrogenase (short-subunit alcohol dehydrogenase family)
MSVALVTGASRGLGRALAEALAARGWDLVVDARTTADLRSVAAVLDASGSGSVVALSGDLVDPDHRRDLVAAVLAHRRLDLLVNNASSLGPSPLPRLADLGPDALGSLYDVNVVAPLALTQPLLDLLRTSAGSIVNVSSDAGVEAYERWGGYGSSKAALDRLTAVLAVEEPTLHVYAFDPGDMRTRMHQDAFPGEDVSDRPDPETVVPLLLHLVDDRPPSGRYRASDLAARSAA